MMDSTKNGGVRPRSVKDCRRLWMAAAALLMWAGWEMPLSAATIGPGSDSIVLNPLADSGTAATLDVYRIPLTLAAGTYEVTSFSFHNVTLNASPTAPGSVTPFLAILTNPGEDLIGPSRAYQSVWAGPTTSMQNIADLNDYDNAANIVDVSYAAGSQRFTLLAETTIYAGIFTQGTGRVAYRTPLPGVLQGRVDHDVSFSPVTGPGQAIAGFSSPFQNRFYAFELEIVPSDALPAVPGDFNGDRNVDGADFVVWQTNFPATSGKTLATGDANGDGAVDGADFVIWQTNFPTTSGGTTVAVPEPTTAAAAVWMALVTSGALAHRRRQNAAG